MKMLYFKKEKENENACYSLCAVKGSRTYKFLLDLHASLRETMGFVHILTAKANHSV